MREADEWFDMSHYCEDCVDCDMDPAQCYELGRCIYDMAMDDLLEEQ